MEHTDVAQVAALAGAFGSVLVLIPRGRTFPLIGFALLGLATIALAWSLVGSDDVEVLFGDVRGIALIGVGAAAAIIGATALARYPAAVPVALLAVAPFRIPVELGSEEAFLLLPLYLVLAAAVLALAYRLVLGKVESAPPLLLALPAAAFTTFASISFLWTWDERQGAIVLAFFVFPFVAGVATVARSPVETWLPRALLATLVALGSLFAAIGIWQAHARTLFFARDLEVANAYTTFFRVTSLFKDPSLYGRYLVIPIAVLLVVVLVRRGRPIEWIAAAALIAFLFWGLFYSYSQSSFAALFVVTFCVALVGVDRRTRTVLVTCAAVATLAAAAVAGAAVGGQSAKDVTSGRSRLVSDTIEVVKERPVAGVGVGGQPKASAELLELRSASRSASHTTPLTVLAELGVLGFALYVWLLAAIGWALYLVTKHDRAFGIGLSAVMLALFVHSLFYSGFFEDPLTWGVLGVTAAVLGSVPAPTPARADDAGAAASSPEAGGIVTTGAPSSLVPRRVTWIVVAVVALLVVLGGAAGAYLLTLRDRTEGALDTDLSGVTVSEATVTEPTPKPPAAEDEQASGRVCWRFFGGDPQRSLARPELNLGLPREPLVWTRGLGSYIEYPPSYCDGMLYVNTFEGDTFALDADTGEIAWRKRYGAEKPSTPAIDGPRLIVSSKDGAVRALGREHGKLLWTVQTAGKVESSAAVVDGVAYFGSTDGRLFAVHSDTGRIRWAYDTGGRINASPSIFGRRVCISTYVGSVVCVNKDTGSEIWTTYVARDTFRDESFYASPSTDGTRLYVVSRSGTVVALNAQDGDVLWTSRVGGYGYTTPAVADGVVYVGGFDGILRALRATTGAEIWRTRAVGGRILGAPVVVGNLVYFAVLERKTYAARRSDGRIVWTLPMGRYSPVIATETTYFFSLNGRLIAYRGRHVRQG